MSPIITYKSLFIWHVSDKKSNRQTDILLTEIQVITDLFVLVIMVMREIYVYTRMLIC